MANPTIKQEKFCHVYVETGNASEAYRQAYDTENMSASTVAEEACKLLKNPNVAPMLEELKAALKNSHEVRAESVCSELDNIISLAISRGQCSAAVTAVMGKAKIYGLLIDKVEDNREPPVLQIVMPGED